MNQEDDTGWSNGWSDTAVIQAHPELHHYTTAETLGAMISSNSFWASHFRHLNDSTEILGIGARIRPEWARSFEAILRSMRKRAKVERAILAAGGLKSSAASLAESLYDVLADVTFGTTTRPPTQTVSGAPFILSFCSHTSEPYEASNGLLSQWRGYSAGRGVCLVFDTEGLFKNLAAEYRRFAYAHAGFHDVLYDREGLQLENEFPELFDAVDTYVRIKMGLRVPDPGAETISQFIVAATRYKHQGFHEEREVRIVVCPVDERFFAQDANTPKPPLPAKPSFSVGGKERIALFEGQVRPLPLRRIIVGPSRDMDEVAQYAREVTKGEVEITMSQTPFIPR